MSLPTSLQGALDASAYPHTCQPIELIETHISWVLLTGEFVYKLKRPVRFAFLDFSTLELREHFCREELRCNRLFAARLYIDVVPITRRADGSLTVGGAPAGDATIVEWAVQMHQFDPAAQLDRLLARDAVTPRMLRDFGAALAALHSSLPRLTAPPSELEERTFGPVRDNFSEIATTGLHAKHQELLARVEALSDAQQQRQAALITERLQTGYVRECHGDLHLSNLALIDNAVTAFDCLEFNPLLRWVDTVSDVAFLFMDCHERGRSDLAYAFLNAYLNTSGDYRGAELLAYFAAYRSMVRAKVAALRWQQEPSAEREARWARHVAWADAWLTRPTGKLVLMCGLSGSGKSYAAERLAGLLPAVHLRSDVARKQLAGLDVLAQTDSPVGAGLYAPGRSDEVFAHLAAVAAELLRDGEHVIVDATFIERARRQAFLEVAAQQGATVRIVLCDAPVEILRARIATRAAEQTDASEANLDVLAAQLAKFEPPDDTEPSVTLASGSSLSAAELDQLVRQL